MRAAAATLHPALELSTVGHGFVVADASGGGSRDVTIDASAFGEVRGRSFIALACSNHYIVLRLITRARRPCMRLVPWFTSSSKRIVGLTFGESCQWLLAATVGGRVYLIPALDLVGARTRPPPETPIAAPQLASFTVSALLKPQGSPNLVPVTTIRPRQGRVHCCIWWKSNGRDLALLGVDSGDIVVIDLRRREEVEVISVSSSPVVAIALIKIRAEVSGIDQHILATAEGMKQWICPIERTAANGTVTNVVGRASERNFTPIRLTNCDNCLVSVQRVDGRERLGVYHTASGRLDLHNLETPRLSGGERRLATPVKTLYLPCGRDSSTAMDVRSIIVDEKYRSTLVLARGVTPGTARKHSVLVVSNKIASQPPPTTLSRTEKGSSAAVEAAAMSTTAAVVVTRLYPSFGDGALSSHGSVRLSTASMVDGVPSYYVTGGSVVYRCTIEQSLLVAELPLLVASREISTRDAECLGLVAGVDVDAVFERAAQRTLSGSSALPPASAPRTAGTSEGALVSASKRNQNADAGGGGAFASVLQVPNEIVTVQVARPSISTSTLAEQQRDGVGKKKIGEEDAPGAVVVEHDATVHALELFSRARTAPANVAVWLAQAGHIAAAAEHLRDALAVETSSRSVLERGFLADLLLQCRLIMSSQVVAGAGGDDDDARALRELLVTDDAYDPTLALTLLVRSGCILEAFLVAERCHCIPTAFTTMVQNGMLRLPSDAAEHLIECGHAKALLEAADGGFFRTLPRALQLSSLIAYPTGLSPSIGKKECDFSNWIACELPLMNRSELIWFAKEITRIVNALPLPSLAELPGESTSFTEAAPERTSLLELFIATVVAALSFEAREKVELADVAGPSQVELEQLLQRQFQEYRTHVVVSHCIAWCNWSAAAIVYESAGEWGEMLRCNLIHLTLESRARGSATDPESLVQLLNKILRKLAQGGAVGDSADGTSRTASESAPSRLRVHTALVANVIAFWHTRNVGRLDLLEKWLSSALSDIPRLMGPILFRLFLMPITLARSTDDGAMTLAEEAEGISPRGSKATATAASSVEDVLHAVHSTRIPALLFARDANRMRTVSIDPRGHELEAARRSNDTTMDSEEWRALTVQPRWTERSDIETCRRVEFSPALLIQVAAAQLGAVPMHPLAASIIAAEDRRVSGVNRRQMPTETLWRDILGNLKKGIDKRASIDVPLRPEQLALARATVIFTCGHSFTTDSFRRSVLPEFGRRLRAFPYALPVTARLVVAEYKQLLAEPATPGAASGCVSLACPVCVHNYLRREQQQLELDDPDGLVSIGSRWEAA